MGLLLAWGDRPLLFDEESYRRAAEALAAWVRAGLPGGDLEGPGRVAWHNPGYGLVLGGLSLLGADPVSAMRWLQLLAGLLSGVLLYRTLEPRTGPGPAIAATAALWLHPSMLFFGLTLWPTTLATLGTSALLFTAARWQARPDAPARQWELGAALAVLPFFASGALLLLPAVALWVRPERWPRVLGPAALVLVPWCLALSLQVGAFVPLDLAAARNLALGNTEWVAEGRGSLWGDPQNKAPLLQKLEDDCGPGVDALRLACEQRWARREVRRWVGAHPGAAASRAALRVVETWASDTFLPRHLHHAVPFPGGPPPGAAAIGHATSAAHAAVLLLLLLVGVATHRMARLRPLLIGVALWTLPAFLAIGMTRLRQPALVWILAGAALVFARVRDRRVSGA